MKNITYKGFNKDMTCRGFQYEEGKTYREDNVIACEKGFHACEHPLDCLKYYPPNNSVYHEVEQNGILSKNGDDSKIASSEIKIGAEITIVGLVKAAIEYTKKRVISEIQSDGSCGVSSAENAESIAVAWGYHGKAKGVLGSYLVLADWEGNENNYWIPSEWTLKGAKMVQVDGSKIKENTFYTMINGEIVEAEE